METKPLSQVDNSRDNSELESGVAEVLGKVLSDHAGIFKKLDQMKLDKIGILQCKVCLQDFKPKSIVQAHGCICSVQCTKDKYGWE